MNDGKFSLQKQYQKYLQLAGVTEAQMIPIQKQEMKRAFMGGCGQLLVLMREDLAELEEEEGAKVLQDMLTEVTEFWLAEQKATN